MPNFYPQCSKPAIIKQLLNLNPCIDIVKLNTSLLTQNTQGKGELSRLIEMGKQLRGTTDKDDKGTVIGGTGNVEKGLSDATEIIEGNKDQIHVFNNVFGFLSLMTALFENSYENIPIFNSPQIKINNSAGYKHEQSLLSFVKALTTQGIGGVILKGIGLNNIVDAGFDEVERLASFAGWSPRVGPHWSLMDNPFNDRPSLQADIKLINDSEQTAKENSMFLDDIIKDVLVTTGSGRESHGLSSGSGFGRWYPPKLFNVGLKWGANAKTNYVKRYYLCTLEASVSYEGVVRKSGYPDAYSVSLNFSSLLPDTLDIWGVYGFLKSEENITLFEKREKLNKRYEELARRIREIGDSDDPELAKERVDRKNEQKGIIKDLQNLTASKLQN